MRISIAITTLAIFLAGCAPQPPLLPFITVGEYSGRCGYDWNDRGVELASIPKAAMDWSGSRDVLMVFRFEPSSEACFKAARKMYRSLGFRRIYIVKMGYPKTGDPPLVPFYWPRPI
jgi:hypothetical protein